MTVALAVSQPTARRPNYRRQTLLIEAGSVVLGIVLLIWSLFPIYNMFLIALDPEEGEIQFSGNLWISEPSLDSFLDVITQKAGYLEDFWHQFGNSIFIGLLTMVQTCMGVFLSSGFLLLPVSCLERKGRSSSRRLRSGSRSARKGVKGPKC